MRSIAKILSVFTLALLSTSAFAASEKGKADYWIKNYKEVRKGPLFNRTMEVFRKVLASADRRKGVEPRVYVIEYEGLPWAQSLEDGSIILTRKAVEFCYRDMEKTAGDARLAFVLGHELAHQLNADFWPYRFEASAKNNPELSSVKEFNRSPEAIKGIELQADQYGVVYAALAGYRTDVIVSKDFNFFKDWFKAIDLAYASAGSEDVSLNQRVFAVTARLNEISSKIEFFHFGVIAYHLGWHKEATALFNEFLKFYPGREVYHNIGTAYLKMALKSYRDSRPMEAMPFYLSVEDDLVTRAADIEAGREDDRKTSGEFRENIEKAIEFLKKASESDPYYVLAKINLGAAYILDERYYHALSELEEASKLNPKNIDVLNNTAIAHFMIGELLKDEVFKEKAHKELEKAAKSGCGKIIGRNFAIAARKLGKSDETLMHEFYVEGEEIDLPQIGIAERVGKDFVKTDGLINIGEINARDMKIALYSNPKRNEIIFVKDGLTKAVYKKIDDKAQFKRRGCDGQEVISLKGRGVDLKRNMVFVYHD